MTEQQKNDFDENGFIVLEDFLTPDELDRLLSEVDEVGAKVRSAKGLGPGDPFAVRNALAHHEAFLDLIDHSRMLPLVVDAIGWNIQIRTSHLDYRPPYPRDLRAGALGSGTGADHEAGYRNVVWHPDLAGDYLLEAPSLDGRLPFMEVKVFYVLSDLTESNSGNLWLLPGSHRRRPQELRDLDNQVDPDEAVELRLPRGLPCCGAPPPGTAWVPTCPTGHGRSCTSATITAGSVPPTTCARIPSWSPAARRSDASCSASWPPAATRWATIPSSTPRPSIGPRQMPAGTTFL